MQKREMERQWRATVDTRLDSGYRYWRETGRPELCRSERYVAAQALPADGDDPGYPELAAACQCFYWFRRLHGSEEPDPADAVLMGDYFFSQFSQCMIPLDSPALTDAFADFLLEDACRGGDREAYLAFVRGLPKKRLVVSDQTRETVPEPEEDGAVYEEIGRELDFLTQRLEEACRVPGRPDMERDLSRLTLAGGKRLRPILAWICWKMQHGTERMPILPLMEMLELMHTASLIHDDIVDRGELRRGVETINRSSGPRAAVQCGDYLLGRAMRILKIYRGTKINNLLAGVSEEMCCGELQQRRECFRMGTAETYYRRIHCKTASLLAASCATGAMAGRGRTETVEALRTYGEELGLAFQIRDDLLDIVPGFGFGKRTGQDLRDGIMTLPILYAAEEGLPPRESALLLKKEKDPDDIRELTAAILETGAAARTQQEIERHSAAAVRALQDVAPCAERDMLEKLAGSLAERIS